MSSLNNVCSVCNSPFATRLNHSQRQRQHPSPVDGLRNSTSPWQYFLQRMLSNTWLFDLGIRVIILASALRLDLASRAVLKKDEKFGPQNEPYVTFRVVIALLLG